MRWFVDISPLGSSGGQKLKWCVEAAGWQPALKEARALRGEEGPLGGFSIELLDDGARAVDPAAKIRYVIREAPADAPLTHALGGPVSGAAKSEPAKVEAAPKSEPKPAAAVKSEPAKVEAAPKSEPAKVEAAPKSEPKPAVKSEPAKVEAKPAAVAVEADDVDIPVDTEDAGGEETARAPGLPEARLLQSREEDPTERSPLTYREQVYVVDEATSDGDVERLILARFEALKEGLAAAKPGRFVNLAVFDQAFTGKPTKRPRATLTWKDWRGAPEIRFPASDRASLQPPSFSAPTSASQSVPQPSIVPPEPSAAKAKVSVPPPTEVAPTEPAPVASTERAGAVSVGPAAAAHAHPPARQPGPVTEAPKTEAPKTAESRTDAPKVDASKDAPTVVAPKPDAPTVVASAPEKPAAAPKIEVAAEAGAQRPSLPVSSAPATMPAVTPTKREAFIPKVKTAAEAGRRVTGDDLIGELFEACGDLQFARDSLEGADFVLNLALEKLPSEVAMVSFFDINRREFVVVRQAGGPRSMVLSRLPERAGLAQAAMRKKAAIVVADARKEPRALDDRFRTLGVEQRSLIVAPVEQSGRYLGLIELLNPVDGRAFTESDGNALTYIGEQFAEFVAERGLVVDPETVLERHQKK